MGALTGTVIAAIALAGAIANDAAAQKWPDKLMRAKPRELPELLRRYGKP